MLTVVKAQKLNTQHVTENTSKDPIISICQGINEELGAYRQTLKEHRQTLKDGFGSIEVRFKRLGYIFGCLFMGEVSFLAKSVTPRATDRYTI